MNSMYQNQMFPNPYLNRSTSPIPPQNGIQWVQGIEGAKAWQLMPNGNAVLMDSENDGRFYIKTSDNVGMCNLRVFKFEEITDAAKTPSIDLSDYVRKDELQSLISSMIGGQKHESTVSANNRSTELSVITQ